MKVSKDQHGLSLIELIIIITIIAITAGIVTMTFSIVNAITAKSCASNIDSSIEKVKTEAMSKANNVYLVIYKEAVDGEEGYFVACTSDPYTYKKNINGSNRVADRNMSIQAVLEDGTEIDVGENMIFLSFDRENGSLQECLVKAGDNKIVESGYISQIKITGKGRESAIHLISETGKHYVE